MGDASRRRHALTSLAEATFWQELAYAAPALLDVIASTRDQRVWRRVGRALRAACKRCVASAEAPRRSALLAVHGHARLVGLRYAPLVREVHRPLLLRFLVEQAVEVDEIRARAPLKVVHLPPPPFMGPPSRPPTGQMAPPPTELPEPSQIEAAVEGGGGGAAAMGYARAPIRMGPPKGKPSADVGGGGAADVLGVPLPPPVLPPPTETPQLVVREMLAPQKLSSMTQLLRRVATAMDVDVDGGGGGGGGGGSRGRGGNGVADFGSVAAKALRGSKAGANSHQPGKRKTAADDSGVPLLADL